MKYRAYQRYGELVDILAEICDVERQLVTQGQYPFDFVPERLLDRWYSTFQTGRGLTRSNLSDDLLACLLDFDYHLSQVVDALPDDADNKEEYIQHDEIWQIVREMADWTLTRLSIVHIPEDAEFSLN